MMKKESDTKIGDFLVESGMISESERNGCS